MSYISYNRYVTVVAAVVLASLTTTCPCLIHLIPNQISSFFLQPN